MYSLPITTYSDYWRATKVWTSYLGGLAVFAAGTRYSTLGAPEIAQTFHMPFQQTTQSLITKNLGTEVAFSDSREKSFKQGIVGQDTPKPGEISRGVLNLTAPYLGEVSDGELGQDAPGLGAVSDEGLSQSIPNLSTVGGDGLNQEELSLNAVRGRGLSQDVIDLGAVRQVVFNHGPISRGAVSRGITGRGVSSQEVSNSEVTDQGVEERKTSQTQMEDKEIPFETQYIESDEIPPGESQIQEKGEKGIFRQVVKTFEVGGEPVDQQVQASYELKSPKKEVILRNSKPVPKKKVIIQNSKPAEAENVELDQANISKTLTVEATAYTYTGNKTATGVEPREGLIAVDPKVIAMGSKVYVEGYGYAIAADTGGDIRGNRIDVFFATLRQCINWGRKPVHIYVLNPT